MSHRRSPTLVDKAVARLREGPTHTLELAEAIGISGHPGAASAAVFTLLGSDARFRVDAEGSWTLTDRVSVPGSPLHELDYAVVDVETTGGGYGRGHRVTEVAIVEVSGGEIAGEFSSLVNPGRPIPRNVQRLTGISDRMVATAPYFDHVAEEVFDRLSGRVFVAHNVAFDWAFVSRQLLDSLGLLPDVARLCTVQMARRFVPELRHRNLDSVSRHFGIPIHARHRAHGDALATARVLLRLLDAASHEGLHDLTALQSFLAARRSRRGASPSPKRNAG